MNKKRAYLYKIIKSKYSQLMTESLLKYARLSSVILERAIGYILVTKYYKKIILRYNIKTFLKNLLKT
jgi:hypothetical protein